MEHWAKVDGGHIARFGELTKREIQVVCYLFLCRNGANDQCNPKRKQIAAGTGITDRGNLSKAIDGLERKGWIADEGRAGFRLFAADEIPAPDAAAIVVKSTTKTPAEMLSNRQQKAVKSTTEPDAGDPGLLSNRQQNVVKLTTKGCQIDNTHIKESEQTKNRQRTDKRRAPRKSPPAKKAKPQKSLIPIPFELTDEMVSWFRENVAAELRIGPAAAHLEFCNYWVNLGDVKKAYKVDWLLTWKNGMQNLVKWQRRDDLAAGVKTGADWRNVGKDDRPPEPDPFAALPDCFICENQRSALKIIFPNAEYSWVREQLVPCENCRPDDFAAWEPYKPAEKDAA